MPARIPFYWIVNLKDRRLELHSDPSGPDVSPTYRQKQDIAEDGMVVLTFPNGTSVELPVKDIFPKKVAK